MKKMLAGMLILWTHAILGLTGIFRLWSGWDAMIQRDGGRWGGKI